MSDITAEEIFSKNKRLKAKYDRMKRGPVKTGRKSGAAWKQPRPDLPIDRQMMAARKKTKENLAVSLSHKMGSIKRLVTALPKGFEEGLFFLLQAAEKDEDVKNLMEAWQMRGMPTNDDSFFDDLCKEMNIDSTQVIKRMCEAAHEYSSMLSFMVADSGMPAVIKRSVAEAKKSGGIKDREFLATARGFLPTKTGIQINNNTAVQLNDAEDTVTITLPSFDSNAVESCDAMREE